MSLTDGEFKVGSKFNPSKSESIDKLKKQGADFIDMVNQIKLDIRYFKTHEEMAFMSEQKQMDHKYLVAEVERCVGLAVKAIEEGAMWAVKAETKHLIDFHEGEEDEKMDDRSGCY